MIDLYYWPTPNGWKISIMLEECGLPYTMVPVNIGKGDQFKPEFLAISPNNRMPAIVDHDVEGEPISVFESGAILLYLAEKTGRFLPTDKRARIKVLEWLFWQMANLGPMMGQVNHFVKYAPQITDKDLSYGRERYMNEGRRLMTIMEKQLGEFEYIAGDYSIADMACWPWTLGKEELGYDMSEFPNLARWIEAIGARPAVVAGFAVGAEFRRSGKLDEEDKKILFGQGAPERDKK